MKRLFFALWPDEDIRQQCHQLARTLSDRGGRVVIPKNLHVTLSFLGHVNAETEQAITEAATGISITTMQIAFDRIEFWRKPKILCLCSQNPDPVVTALAQDLTALAAQAGIATDLRSFTPHVTLLRKAVRPVSINFAPIIWSAHSFCLAESCSLPEGGVEYQVLRRWSMPTASA